MRSDEELIAERNMQIIAQALIDIMIKILDLNGGSKLLDQYYEQLNEIVINGNSI